MKAMLIDEFLPEFEAGHRHSIQIDAAAEDVYAAIRTADLARSPVVRALLAARALPAAIKHGLPGLRLLRRSARQRITLAAFELRGFEVLAEEPRRELLLGLVGAFWTLRGGLCATSPGHFRGPQRPDTARAAWNFSIEPLDGARGVRLSTETRVSTSDAASRRRFRIYWRVVGPFSALTRRLMLRAIRDEATRGG